VLGLGPVNTYVYPAAFIGLTDEELRFREHEGGDVRAAVRAFPCLLRECIPGFAVAVNAIRSLAVWTLNSRFVHIEIRGLSG
jgi:hypothetical protein